MIDYAETGIPPICQAHLGPTLTWSCNECGMDYRRGAINEVIRKRRGPGREQRGRGPAPTALVGGNADRDPRRVLVFWQYMSRKAARPSCSVAFGDLRLCCRWRAEEPGRDTRCDGLEPGPGSSSAIVRHGVRPVAWFALV